VRGLWEILMGEEKRKKVRTRKKENGKRKKRENKKEMRRVLWSFHPFTHLTKLFCQTFL
jgi:hypothetical protein